MRKFYFENSIGERVDLQSSIVFHAPSGLGVANESTYGRVSDGFHALTYSTLAQGNIVGELVFTTGYAGYKTFVDWVYKGYDLKLVYAPATTEYYRDIEVEYVQKTELGSGGWLVCPVSLICKSPWYKPTPIQISLAPSSTGSYRVYNYTYDVIYPTSASANSVDITPAGHLGAALYIEVDGALESPVITLTRQSDGEVLGTIDLNGLSVDSSTTLIYSSRVGAMGIWTLTGGVLTDQIDYIDLADNNFFSIPAGVPCTLTLSSDTTISTIAAVQLYEYYKAV